MRYIGNAFSAGMLAGNSNVSFRFIELDEAIAFVKIKPEYIFMKEPISCVGHTDTALLISALLGVEIAVNRCSTILFPGDRILIAQYNGPRLPEGAKSLPDGAKIRWILASVN